MNETLGVLPRRYERAAAMVRPPQHRTVREQVVFVGTPADSDEMARWATMLDWVQAHGLQATTQISAEGRTVCAVTTDDVLDCYCRPADAMTLQQVHAQGVPCVNVFDDPDRILDVLTGATEADEPPDADPREELSAVGRYMGVA
ncbi:hypothetical protein [Rhodococcus wratislaviensis]|uniref:hypothetical protein n=1 Tax=Rhodococcus wratislaviensis TaxID=44752 RepID=UPI000F57F8D9|nr:hypothetical protein [Rhodococcus wratislaviensis]